MPTGPTGRITIAWRRTDGGTALGRRESSARGAAGLPMGQTSGITRTRRRTKYRRNTESCAANCARSGGVAESHHTRPGGKLINGTTWGALNRRREGRQGRRWDRLVASQVVPGGEQTLAKTQKAALSSARETAGSPMGPTSRISEAWRRTDDGTTWDAVNPLSRTIFTRIIRQGHQGYQGF